MALVTKYEAMRASLVTVCILVLSLIGQWLADTSPETLVVWRFVNGFVLLWLIVVLLFKWHTLQSLLTDHLSQIEALFARESREVAELTRRAAAIAKEVAERNEAESKKRHEHLPERIAEVIANRESRVLQEAIEKQEHLAHVSEDTNRVVHETHEVITEKLNGHVDGDDES